MNMHKIEKALQIHHSQKKDRHQIKDHKNNNVNINNSNKSASTTTTERVAIDFNQLYRAGIITPNNKNRKLSEEYKKTKRPLLKNCFGQDPLTQHNANLILVTSACPGEGKTFNAINLAISMAMECDHTVLLIDADVINPSISRVLGIQNNIGLVDYLISDTLSLSDILIHTDIPKLKLLPAGKEHSLTNELLASKKMQSLMDELSSRYTDRVVIFDSPPLLNTTESIVLAQFVGQIVLVVEENKTPQPAVKEAISLLDTNMAINILLNKSTGTDKSYYGYGYGVTE